MEKIKLLIIDDNRSLIGMVTEFFKKTDEIEVPYIAYDGEEGLEIIKNHRNEFDLILLDLVMPKKDGLAVLEYIRDNSINKKVIVLTSYNTQDMIRKVAELGACYFMLKPFELSYLQEKIESIYEDHKRVSESVDIFQNNLQVSISNTLHELGVPSHIKGYQYIREGITLVFKNPEYRRNYQRIISNYRKNI